MILKCRELSGANLKKNILKIPKFSEICQKHENPLTTVFKKKIENHRTSSKNSELFKVFGKSLTSTSKNVNENRIILVKSTKLYKK